MLIVHPFYEPLEPVTPDTRVDALSVNVAGTSGVDGWATLWGRPVVPAGYLREALPAAFDAGPARPVRFRVVVCDILPGPQLAPPDPDALRWLEAQGWAGGLEGARMRWAELFNSGELERNAAQLAKAEAIEHERRRAEDLARPGFADELFDQGGRTYAAALEALKRAVRPALLYLAGGVAVWGLVRIATRRRGKR